jgi:hypothetical protein
MKGRHVCAMHGGKTPVGPRSKSWKHGGYSLYPDGTRKHLAIAASDPSLLEPKGVAALMHGLTLQLFGQMKADGREPGPADIAAVTTLQDRRLSAIAAHDRRRKWEAETITRGQLHSFMAGVVAAVHEHVSDEGEQARLLAVMRRLAGPEGVRHGDE